MSETIPERIGALEEQVRAAGRALGLAEKLVEDALGGLDYFALAEATVPLRPTAPPQPVAGMLTAAQALLRIKAFRFPPPGPSGEVTPVVFGTGGHRGEIGVGLTLTHIRVVVEALLAQIEAMPPAGRNRHFGAETMDGVRERGFVIGHDNRMLNPEFSFFTAGILSAAGFRTAYAGRVATPQISVMVPRQGWAGAFNFTPSHNPFRYGGIKVNPADGGLVSTELSDPLAVEANRRLGRLRRESWPPLDELEAGIAAQAEAMERVDLHTPYLEALDAQPVIRLGELARELKHQAAEGGVAYVVDPIFGASVPIYTRLRERLGEQVMTLLHTEDDPFFGGQTTEPSAAMLAEAQAVLRASPAALKVAIRNDPDCDRGLVGDDRRAIPMNQFAALVMKYLIDLGTPGDVATTVATSRFGGDYARGHGRKVHLTPVGVKNFRPYLLDRRAMVAYEESDGITIAGHSLDKDGVLAGLLALRIVLHYGKPLSTLIEALERETGAYHYRQINFAVDITAAEVREKLKILASVQTGENLGGTEKPRTVTAVNTTDGYGFDFAEGGWILLRPSGTEPKVRVYAESRESAAETEALCELGKALALQAVHGR